MKVIKNGRIFYKNQLIEAQIGIQGSKIQEIKKTGLNGKEIDASGCIVLPSGIDVHVHFRDFKQKQKEDWKTGSKAAVAGGITTVFDHPNTDPQVKSTRVFRKKKRRAQNKSFVDFGINAAGTEDSDLGGLAKAGASAFGEIFFTKPSDLGLSKKQAKDVLGVINQLNKKACIHAEDHEILRETKNRFKNKSPIYFSDSRPKKAEISAIKKMIDVEESQKLHFCHITTQRGVKLVNRSDHTSEVTPHHLFFRKQKLEEIKSYIKTNPPIRDDKNRKRLWKLFKTGKIDVLASDHAPHTIEEKQKNFWEAPAGVPGVQAMYPLMAYQVKRNNLDLNRLVQAISKNPAKTFGLNKGKIEKGRYADLVIMDFNEIKEINKRKMHSKCNWTPYEGKEAIFPKKTLLRGDVIYSDGNFTKKKGGMIGTVQLRVK